MKSPAQQAYEKYCEYQLRIPRMQIRPLTWEELKDVHGNGQKMWEEIAKIAHDAYCQ